MKVKKTFEQKKRCPEEFEALLKDTEDVNNTFLTFKAESQVCQ